MDPSRISFRPRATTDDADMRRVFEESRDHILPQLPDALRGTIAEMQFRAFEASLTDRDTLRDEVILVDGAVVGRVVTRECADPFIGIDFGVVSSVRSLGIGTHVMERFLRRADAVSAGIVIHVRLGNPAERLYERMGFVRASTNDIDATMQRVPVGRRTIG